MIIVIALASFGGSMRVIGYRFLTLAWKNRDYDGVVKGLFMMSFQPRANANNLKKHYTKNGNGAVHPQDLADR